MRSMSSSRTRAPSAEKDMRRSYARVLIVWVVTLLALYAFQEYFS
jgi:hypothetical protein